MLVRPRLYMGFAREMTLPADWHTVSQHAPFPDLSLPVSDAHPALICRRL
jgi:hypothetical protein